MKLKISILVILSALTLKAQSQVGDNFFDQLTSSSVILQETGIVKGAKEVKQFVSDFAKTNGKEHTYEQNFTIDVNSSLKYEAGEIQAGDKSFHVMFSRNVDNTGSNIELFVIYENNNISDLPKVVDSQRDKWMELCNAHQAEELVKQVYTSDAYYYNRGRLLQGTKAISQEYGYMNSPSYSLKLTPKFVNFVSENVIYEIGRCSGSYPLPYMLLWEKQADGTWQVLMDSNY